MSFARSRVVQGLQCSLKHSGARASPRLATASARTRSVAGRRFASGGGHGHAAPSSDLPWLIGAIAVTIPSAYYLWPSATHADHGHHNAHGKHDEGHAEEHEQSEEKESAEEEPAEEPKEEDNQAEEKSESTSDDAKPSEGEESSSEEAESKEKVEESSGEGNGDSQGVEFKGKTIEGKEDSRKVEDDHKGAQKKRIDSGIGRNLGEDAETTSDANEDASTAKTPKKGSQGDITGKQFGLSTTATRHSNPDERMSEISTKGEGTPETAKAMGTVDPNRTQK